MTGLKNEVDKLGKIILSEKKSHTNKIKALSNIANMLRNYDKQNKRDKK